MVCLQCQKLPWLASLGIGSFFINVMHAKTGCIEHQGQYYWGKPWVILKGVISLIGIYESLKAHNVFANSTTTIQTYTHARIYSYTTCSMQNMCISSSGLYKCSIEQLMGGIDQPCVITHGWFLVFGAHCECVVSMHLGRLLIDPLAPKRACGAASI